MALDLTQPHGLIEGHPWGARYVQNDVLYDIHGTEVREPKGWDDLWMEARNGFGAGAKALVSPALILQQQYDLTAVRLAAAAVDPLVVIPAPGPGKMVRIIDVVANVIKGSAPTASTNGAELAFFYGDSDGVRIFTNNGVLDPDNLGNEDQSITSVTRGAPAALAAEYQKVADQPIVVVSAGRLTGVTIAALAIAAPGEDYAIGDTGTINHSDLDSGLAAYVVTEVDDAGAVTGLTLTSLGEATSTYVPGITPTTAEGDQAGEGTGLTVNITEVAIATDSTVRYSFLYQILDLLN